MANKKRYNVVYGEKYGDVNDPKTKWHKVGTLFVDEEDGRMSIKIDTMPVGRNFNGFLSVFEPREDDGQGGRQNYGGQGASRNPAAGQSGDENTPPPTDDDAPINLDDIPF